MKDLMKIIGLVVGIITMVFAGGYMMAHASMNVRAISHQPKMYNTYECTGDTVFVNQKSWRVHATVYYPTGNPTADGSEIFTPYSRQENRWIAVSRDLLKKGLTYGDSVYVSGINNYVDGFYVVKDTMNSRHKKRIDILIGKNSPLMGSWKNVIITKYEE